VLHTSLCPSSVYLTNAPCEGDGFVQRLDSALVSEYEDIFIKVKEWGAFEMSDIERNGLRQFVGGTVPDFVAKFERELHSKAGLAPEVRRFLDHSFDADGPM